MSCSTRPVYPDECAGLEPALVQVPVACRSYRPDGIRTDVDSATRTRRQMTVGWVFNTVTASGPLRQPGPTCRPHRLDGTRNQRRAMTHRFKVPLGPGTSVHTGPASSNGRVVFSTPSPLQGPGGPPGPTGDYLPFHKPRRPETTFNRVPRRIFPQIHPFG